MMSLILIAAVAVFVLRRVCGVVACPGPRVHSLGRGGRRGLGVRGVPGADLPDPWRGRETSPPEAPAARAEPPLESLQRRFASGAISVEEYEREVGKLYGLK